MLVDLLIPFDSYGQMGKKVREIHKGEGNVLENVLSLSKEYVKSIPGTMILGSAAKQLANPVTASNIAGKLGLSGRAATLASKGISSSGRALYSGAKTYSTAVPKVTKLTGTTVGQYTSAIAAPLLLAYGYDRLLHNLDNRDLVPVSRHSDGNVQKDFFMNSNLIQDSLANPRRSKAAKIFSLTKDMSSYLMDVFKGTTQLVGETISNLSKGGN